MAIGSPTELSTALNSDTPVCVSQAQELQAHLLGNQRRDLHTLGKHSTNSATPHPLPLFLSSLYIRNGKLRGSCQILLASNPTGPCRRSLPKELSLPGPDWPDLVTCPHFRDPITETQGPDTSQRKGHRLNSDPSQGQLGDVIRKGTECCMTPFLLPPMKKDV